MKAYSFTSHLSHKALIYLHKNQSYRNLSRISYKVLRIFVTTFNDKRVWGLFDCHFLNS